MASRLQWSADTGAHYYYVAENLLFHCDVLRLDDYVNLGLLTSMTNGLLACSFRWMESHKVQMRPRHQTLLACAT